MTTKTPPRFRKDRAALLWGALAEFGRLRVVDIGANPLARPPYQRLLDQGGCEVVGFEPQKDAFAELKATEDGRRRYINAAVGPAGPAVLNVYPMSGFTSLYKISASVSAFLGRFSRQLGHETEVPVHLTPMDAIDSLGRVDLLKIDVQGSEMSIISGGRKALAECLVVIPELRFYRIYEGEPLLGDLDVELRAQGFELHKFLHTKTVPLPSSQSARPEIAALGSQLLDGDAVYVRNMEASDDWPAERFARLALAADAVFDSPDLALLCLDRLVARGSVAAEVPEKYADLVVAGARVAQERERRSA